MVQKSPSKIHTRNSGNFTDFGDGFFSVFNPEGYQDKFMITTSNRAWNIVDEYFIDAILGQYQCFSVSINHNFLG